MAERPNQNTESRKYASWGPKFRMDFNNPQMNADGASIYTAYGFTDNRDIHLQMFNESGMFHAHNDRTIEIVGGTKNSGGDVDVEIVGMNGEINITCMKNGAVRIKGSNIILVADEDIDLQAGRNIHLIGKNGKTVIKNQDVSVDGLAGNLVASTIGDFTQRAFEKSFVAPDFPGLKDFVKAIPAFNSVTESLF